MHGQFFSKQPVQMEGLGYKPILIPSLVQKGYGLVTTPSTGNLSLTYGTVNGGSAPVAGDFVVWVVFTYDAGGDPRNDITGSGWAQNNPAGVSSYYGLVCAKRLVAGDLSSPATIVTAPQLGAAGFWVAYTLSGSLASTTIPFGNFKMTTTAAPSNTLVTAGGVAGPVIVVGLGGGDDNTPTLTSSVGEDGSQTINNTVISATEDFMHKWKLYNSPGNASDVTFSKSDDGTGNLLLAAYVRLQ
jgi:hypothetical protein